MKFDDLSQEDQQALLENIGKASGDDFRSVSAALRAVAADFERAAGVLDPRERVEVLLSAEETFREAMGPLLAKLADEEDPS